MCGIADGPADGGFSIGQLYAVAVHALAGPARYLQGSLKSALGLFIDYANRVTWIPELVSQ
jgi:hypothetical protein